MISTPQASPGEAVICPSRAKVFGEIYSGYIQQCLEVLQSYSLEDLSESDCMKICDLYRDSREDPKTRNHILIKWIRIYTDRDESHLKCYVLEFQWKFFSESEALIGEIQNFSINEQWGNVGPVTDKWRNIGQLNINGKSAILHVHNWEYFYLPMFPIWELDDIVILGNKDSWLDILHLDSREVIQFWAIRIEEIVGDPLYKIRIFLSSHPTITYIDYDWENCSELKTVWETFELHWDLLAPMNTGVKVN